LIGHDIGAILLPIGSTYRVGGVRLRRLRPTRLLFSQDFETRNQTRAGLRSLREDPFVRGTVEALKTTPARARSLPPLPPLTTSISPTGAGSLAPVAEPTAPPTPATLAWPAPAAPLPTLGAG